LSDIDGCNSNNPAHARSHSAAVDFVAKGGTLSLWPRRRAPAAEGGGGRGGSAVGQALALCLATGTHRPHAPHDDRPRRGLVGLVHTPSIFKLVSLINFLKYV
jgi:hypothetical protein